MVLPRQQAAENSLAKAVAERDLSLIIFIKYERSRMQVLEREPHCCGGSGCLKSSKQFTSGRALVVERQGQHNRRFLVFLWRLASSKTIIKMRKNRLHVAVGLAGYSYPGRSCHHDLRINSIKIQISSIFNRKLN